METKLLFPEEIKKDLNLEKIRAFLKEYISKSFDGITITVVVVALEKQLFSLMRESFTIHPPENQMGSYYNKTGSIDIYRGKEYLYSIQVKDHTLTNSDIDQAFDKMIKKGATKGQFIYRTTSIPSITELSAKSEKYAKKGLYTSITGINRYIEMMLIKTPLIDSLTLVNNMLEVSNKMNVDSESLYWLLNTTKKHW